jgi:hypothetical protein
LRNELHSPCELALGLPLTNRHPADTTHAQEAANKLTIMMK